MIPANLPCSFGDLDGFASCEPALAALSDELEAAWACQGALMLEKALSAPLPEGSHLLYRGDHEGGFLSNLMIARADGSFSSTSDIFWAMERARQSQLPSSPGDEPPSEEDLRLASEFSELEAEGFFAIQERAEEALWALCSRSPRLFFDACQAAGSVSGQAAAKPGSAVEIALGLGMGATARLIEAARIGSECPPAPAGKARSL